MSRSPMQGRVKKTITIDRSALIVGDPAYLLDGVRMSGFECRGVVFVHTAPRAWIEFDGDDENFREGGRVVVPDGGAIEQLEWNLIPASEAARLRADTQLHFGAVNLGRLRSGRVAGTVYNYRRVALVPMYRFDGAVRSVTVVPPIQGPGDRSPLNAWIETRGRVELG